MGLDPGIRITLTISSLTRGGGAEKAASMLINAWAGKGYLVTVITLFSAPEDEHQINPQVTRLNLGAADAAAKGFSGGPLARIGRLTGFRRHIVSSRPDVVIAVMDRVNVLTLLATLGRKIPVIACEHTDPNVHKISRSWSFMRRILYPRAKAVVVLTQDAADWAARIVPASKVHVIPNPAEMPERVEVEPAEIEAEQAVRRDGEPRQALGEQALDPPSRTVIAMGRLIPLKRFDLLLEAFSRCAARYPNWSLTILGEGPERGRLEESIDKLGLSGRVSMPGQVTEPQRQLARADLFAMSSDYEGFPMSLLEAMAGGLPVVATDCPSGPRAIIRHEVDGILVPPGEVDGLAEALGRLMSDDDLRAEYAGRATEVTDRFGVDKIMSMWDAVMETARK